jgi:hypothetical protein
MSNKPEPMSALPAFGWIIDSRIEPWIDIWLVSLLSQRIRKKCPYGMQETHRISFKYKWRLWSFLIPEKRLQVRNKADGQTYEIGRSQVCLSSDELKNKFEEVKLSHLAKRREAIDRTSCALDCCVKEIQKLNEGMKEVAKELENLGSLEFPARELHAR